MLHYITKKLNVGKVKSADELVVIQVAWPHH